MFSYEIFERLCKEKGVNASTVGRETGIASATFSAWKKGEYTPKPPKMQKIAEYFGVSLNYMTSGEDDAEEDKSEPEKKEDPDLWRNEFYALMDVCRGLNSKSLDRLRAYAEYVRHEQQGGGQYPYAQQNRNREQTVREEKKTVVREKVCRVESGR